MSHVEATITLPPTLVGASDAARLIRELEALDAAVTAQQLRKLQVDVSRVTQTMADVAAANSLDLAERDHRVSLKQQLKLLKSKAPVVHVVFAEQPDPTFMGQIVEWARKELHPRTLLHTGLQPGIVAGCIVRTPSHIYDFSIASILKGKRDILQKLLHDAPAVPDVPAAPVASAPGADQSEADMQVGADGKVVPEKGVPAATVSQLAAEAKS
jgi:hypothetical protein